MYDVFLLANFLKNYKKSFQQIISHNQVHIISKMLHCLVYFGSNFGKFIFLTLTTNFWHFMAISMALFHIYVVQSSSVLFMPVPCSYLLRASNTPYMNAKGTLTYITTKIRQNEKKPHLHRTVMSIGVWNFKRKYLTQNIWLCLWNRHNSLNLVLSFPCECNLIVYLSWKIEPNCFCNRAVSFNKRSPLFDKRAFE